VKAKTKKRFQQVVFYFIIAVFVLGLLLAYLPVTTPAPVATPAPVNQNPESMQNAPNVNVTAAPAQ
jgi:hypothetical protein